MADDVVAEYGRAARRRTKECCEDADQGRLAGTVGAEEAHNRAAPNLQVDVFEGNDLAVRLRDLVDFDCVVHVECEFVPTVVNEREG